MWMHLQPGAPRGLAAGVGGPDADRRRANATVNVIKGHAMLGLGRGDAGAFVRM